MILDQFIEGFFLLILISSYFWAIKVSWLCYQAKRSLTELSWIWFSLILVTLFLGFGYSVRWGNF